MSNPFQVVRDLESAVCEYTGSPYCVAVNSCTAALLLACAWNFRTMPTPLNLSRPNRALQFGKGWAEVIQPIISIPRHTYISVPMAIAHAGGWPEFRDEDWLGYYQLKPYNIYDSARWFSGGMFSRFRQPNSFICLSFQAQKTLGFEQGGAILHDCDAADSWLRRARFDGRAEGVAPKNDRFTQIGWHAYMNPTTAAGLLWKLSYLSQHNEPLPNPEYPDLSLCEVFR